MAHASALGALDPSHLVYVIRGRLGAYNHDPRESKPPSLGYREHSPTVSDTIPNPPGNIRVGGSSEEESRTLRLLTDSEHLTQWPNLEITSEPLSRWNETVESYHLLLQHIAGSTNIVTDALSRRVSEKWMGKVFPEKMLAEDRDVSSISMAPRIKTGLPCASRLFTQEMFVSVLDSASQKRRVGGPGFAALPDARARARG